MTLEEQFGRLIRILQLIENEPGKWDVAAFEVEFGVGTATIERDIRILRKWGTIKRRNGCFAVNDLKLMPSAFTPSEALALVLAGHVAADRIRMPPTDAVRSALKKVNSLLSDQVDSTIRKMKRRVSVGIDLIRECNTETLNEISKAVSGHNPLDITYYVPSRDQTTKRLVEPYGLTFRFGSWYLIGYCKLRNEMRTFGVDRIRGIRVRDDHFKYPADFDLEEYLNRGWQLQANAEPEHVVLRFSKSWAKWISGCKFHPNQKMTEQEDGSLLFEVTVAGVEEIKHWILGFGDRVEVVEPASLREAIAETCARMAAMYDD